MVISRSDVRMIQQIDLKSCHHSSEFAFLADVSEEPAYPDAREDDNGKSGSVAMKRVTNEAVTSLAIIESR